MPLIIVGIIAIIALVIVLNHLDAKRRREFWMGFAQEQGLEFSADRQPDRRPLSPI